MSQERRDSFVFYRSYFEAINEMSEADQILIFRAISEYALNDVNPELTGPAKSIFILIRPTLDANRTKWENGKNGGEHGNKGGRPRKENPEKPTTEPRNNPSKTAPEPLMYNVDVINVEKEKQRAVFDLFRKQYPGTKGGLKTEYDNFIKKHRDHTEALPLLLPAIEAEIKYHANLIASGRDEPYYKNLSTWINGRCWELEFPNATKAQTIEDTKPTPGYFKPIEFTV